MKQGGFVGCWLGGVFFHPLHHLLRFCCDGVSFSLNLEIFFFLNSIYISRVRDYMADEYIP